MCLKPSVCVCVYVCVLFLTHCPQPTRNCGHVPAHAQPAHVRPRLRRVELPVSCPVHHGVHAQKDDDGCVCVRAGCGVVPSEERQCLQVIAGAAVVFFVLARMLA